MGAVDDQAASALTAESRAFCEQLERALATAPAVHTVPPEQTRQDRREGRGLFPAPVFLDSARSLQIPGGEGGVPLRIIEPPGRPIGVFLHIHGGGWTLGENDLQDPRLERVAQDTGMTVVSVGYRLSPETPYPAAADDCEAAALWVIEHGAAELTEAGGEVPLAIGGDSAGAHLTALTLLRLRDRHGLAGAFGAAVLQYGAFDLSMTPSQRQWGERNLVLSTPIIAWFVEQFLPGSEPEQLRDPELSPLYARLHDMPPAVFTVGTQDPLLDDTLFMEARWRASGAATELHVWPEAPHGLLSLPMTVTDAALQREHQFLRRTLSLDDPAPAPRPDLG